MFRRIAEQTGSFSYLVNVIPEENSGEFSFGFSGESGLNFSYLFKNGKIIDSDSNFIGHYRKNELTEISGNVFENYGNTFINNNIKTNSLSRQNLSLNKFFFDESAANYELFFYGESGDFSLSGKEFLNNQETGSIFITNNSERNFTVFSGDIIFNSDDVNLKESFINQNGYQTISGGHTKEFNFLFPMDLSTGSVETSLDLFTDFGNINKKVSFNSNFDLFIDIYLNYEAFYDFTGQNLFEISYNHYRNQETTNDSSELYISLSKTGGPENFKDLKITGVSINTGLQNFDFLGYLNGSGDITGKISFDASGYNNYLSSVDSGVVFYNYITGIEFLTGNYDVFYDLVGTGKASGDILTTVSLTGNHSGGVLNASGYITGAGKLKTQQNLFFSGFWGVYGNFFTGYENFELESDNIFSINPVKYNYSGNATGFYTGTNSNEYSFYSSSYGSESLSFLTGRNDAYIGDVYVDGENGVSNFRKLVNHTSGFFGYAENNKQEKITVDNLTGELYNSGYLYFEGNSFSDHKYWLFSNISGVEYFAYSETGYPFLSKNQNNFDSNYRESLENIPNFSRKLIENDNTVYSPANQDQKITGIDFLYEFSGLSGYAIFSNLSRNNLSYNKEIFSGSSNSLKNQKNNICWCRYSSNSDDTIYFKAFDKMDFDKKNNNLISSANSDFSIYANAFLVSGTGNEAIISGFLSNQNLNSVFSEMDLDIKSGEEYVISFSTSSNSDTGLFLIQFKDNENNDRLGTGYQVSQNCISTSQIHTGRSTEIFQDSHLSGENISNKIYGFNAFNSYQKRNDAFVRTTGTIFTGEIEKNPVSGDAIFNEKVSGNLFGSEKDVLIENNVFLGYKQKSISFSNIFNNSSPKMQILFETASGNYFSNTGTLVPGFDFPNFDSGAYIENFNNYFGPLGFTGFKSGGDFICRYNNYFDGNIRYFYSSSFLTLSNNYTSSGIGDIVNSNHTTGKFLQLNKTIESTGYYESGVNFPSGDFTNDKTKYFNGFFRATGNITGEKNITINDGSGFFDIENITKSPNYFNRIDGNTGMQNAIAVDNFSGSYGRFIPSGWKTKEYPVNLENLTGIFSGISYEKTFTGEYNLFLSTENNFTGSGESFISLGYTGDYNSTGIRYEKVKNIFGSDNMFLFLDKIQNFKNDDILLEISGVNFYTGIKINF